MTTEPPKVIKIFYCYAREDKALRDELEVHLSSLKRQNQITTWYDRQISPGMEWGREIDTHLNTAHIILLLISPHFMASDYCYGIEMKRALERHDSGAARVIPIILRPVDWEDAPFSQLQVLPTDALPVTRWPDRDDAFSDVARSIRKAVKEMLISLKTKEQWLKEGNALFDLKRYEEALAAFEQALHLDPNYVYAHRRKGVVLYNLNRYEEALAAFEQALQLDPNQGFAHHGKGNALYNLKRYEEALAAFEQALHFHPTVYTYHSKGIVLATFSRYEEALAAYEQALRLDPNAAYAYTSKGTALRDLKRPQEALAAFEQALRLDPNAAYAYHGKGTALCDLKRPQEALAAFEQALRLDPNAAYAYYNKALTLEGLGQKREAQQAYERARQLGYSG